MEQEYTGKIKFLLHPSTDGFLSYINEEGETLSIYFCKESNYFKPKHQIWQLGDKLSFTVVQREDGKSYAKVIEFHGNDDFTALCQQADDDGRVFLRGTLQVIEHQLYFSDMQYRLIFKVDKLMPTDIAFSPDDEFDAVLNLEKSKKLVSLPIYDDFSERVARCSEGQTSLSAVIERVNYDYLLVSFSGTPIKGKVISYNRHREYAVGEHIDVTPLSSSNYGFIFSAKGYREDESLFERGAVYQAKISGFRTQGYFVEIVGTEVVGVLDFKHKEDIEPFERDQIVALHYLHRNNSHQFSFATETQYLKRLGKKKQ